MKHLIKNILSDDMPAQPVITLKLCDSEIIDKLSLFYTHKDGNDEKDYEDASGFNLDTLLFSISDGATESIFSKELANMLVESFVSTEVVSEDGIKGMLAGAIEKVKTQWGLMVAGKSLPWYAQEKVEEGAHAAFLGFRIVPISVNNKKGIRRYLTSLPSRYVNVALKWEVAGVGDSCLFIVRGNRLIKSFPIETAAKFDNTPCLISSIGTMDNRDIFIDSGYLAAGDTIYMLSDAIAEWFLNYYEAGQMPWKMLESIVDNAGFQTFVDTLRESKKLKNDDTTLVTLCIGGKVKS
ncbi:MAG: hypothetical protein HQK94_09240 [Nitrospirae bacterium]|nr:hypothetical protein [Nitrospirota bacterium]